jgi:hypothetical protein
MHRAMLRGTETAAGLAIVLESACLLQSPETAAELETLRTRVAELEAERHTTNEALSDAAVQLRANRDLIAELEAARVPGETYPPALPWAALMDHEDLTDFLDELAASAITHASSEAALAEVEATCGRWRLIAEAQHAHNTAPGPDAMTRTFAPTQALREDEDVTPQVQKLRTLLAGQRAAAEGEHYAAVHHSYRIPRDLPPVGGGQ